MPILLIPVNGQIYVAAVFPEKVNEAKAITFSDKEKAERGADGHVLAYSTYTPGCSYTYYSGAGWSKWGFEKLQQIGYDLCTEIRDKI